MIRNVGIVGCGVAGMASAVALARRGVEVTLFEAFDTARPLGSGLLLQPSGLAALRSLGLEQQILDAGSRVRRLEGRDAAGRIVLELDYRRWREAGFGVGVHRGVLFGVLHEALAGAGVTLHTATRIGRIADPERPTLIDSAGGQYGPFDAVIVADGSNSDLRGQLRPAAHAPVYPWGAVWANCPDPDRAFDGALMQVYRRAEVMIGVLPLGRGVEAASPPMVSLFWSLKVSEMDAFYAGDFAAWKARVVGLWPKTQGLLAALRGPQVMARGIYRDVSIGRWSNGACVIIGDAAHGTSPQLGQGANMALIDAVELPDFLLGPRSPAVSLRAYQAARRRHVGLYQIASHAFTPLFQSSGGFWSFIRDWIFAPISRAPGVRNIGALVLTGTARFGPTPKASRP